MSGSIDASYVNAKNVPNHGHMPSLVHRRAMVLFFRLSISQSRHALFHLRSQHILCMQNNLSYIGAALSSFCSVSVAEISQKYTNNQQRFKAEAWTHPSTRSRTTRFPRDFSRNPPSRHGSRHRDGRTIHPHPLPSPLSPRSRR